MDDNKKVSRTITVTLYRRIRLAISHTHRFSFRQTAVFVQATLQQPDLVNGEVSVLSRTGIRLPNKERVLTVREVHA